MDVSRYASQGTHYHADAINLPPSNGKKELVVLRVRPMLNRVLTNTRWTIRQVCGAHEATVSVIRLRVES